MKKAEEYKTHAAECLALARKSTTDEEKAQLRKMAEVWETLAAFRQGADATGLSSIRA
jgi:hypothetical protein